MTDHRSVVLLVCSLLPYRASKLVLPAMRIAGETLDDAVVSSEILGEAPFKWFTISLRLGQEDWFSPTIDPINRTHHDLPLTIELDARELRNWSCDMITNRLETAAVTAIIGAAYRYRLPTTKFRQIRYLCSGYDRPENS